MPVTIKNKSKTLPLDKFVSLVFRHSNIQAPLTRRIENPSFETLNAIFTTGVRHLYGQDITPECITLERFNVINKCMETIGYTVKYNFTLADGTRTLEYNERCTSIGVWFVKLEPPKKRCSGESGSFFTRTGLL